MILSTLNQVAVSCFLLFLTGCAAIDSGSSRDPEYSGSLNRTLMLYTEGAGNPEVTDEFSERVLQNVAEKLGDHDLPSAILRLKTERADRTNQIRAVTERFNPTHVLYLETARKPNENRGGPTMIVFSLRDVASDKIVWRTQHEAVLSKPEEMAERLIRELRGARLLEDRSPEAR
jgi:hypothetical protein